MLIIICLPQLGSINSNCLQRHLQISEREISYKYFFKKKKTTTAIVVDCRLAFTTQSPAQQASDALYLLLISGSCIGSAQMITRELGQNNL